MITCYKEKNKMLEAQVT